MRSVLRATADEARYDHVKIKHHISAAVDITAVDVGHLGKGDWNYLTFSGSILILLPAKTLALAILLDVEAVVRQQDDTTRCWVSAGANVRPQLHVHAKLSSTTLATGAWRTPWSFHH